MNKYTFGNSEGLLINDVDVKNKIIDYLFNSLNLSNYRFNMLDNLKQLHFLKDNKHYVSPNFKGYNYFLIFTKINNNSYCVAIDKKRFSYHKNKLNIKMVKIIKLKIMTSPSMFRGSIFDCKLIFNNNKYFMIVKDCYKFFGNDLTTMDMNEKMTYLNGIIKNQISECKYFTFKINKLFEYEQLDKLINEIIPKSKFDIQGIIFFPIYSGIQIIYTNNKKQKVNIENNESIVNTTHDMIVNIDKILTSRVYSFENNGKKQKLLVEKTDISDVYNLYQNDERIGIAHIPNMKTSFYCRDVFKGKEKEYFNCIYNNDFKKWIPLNTV